MDPQYRNVESWPGKEITAGVLLLVLGVVLICCGVLIHLEHWENNVPGVVLLEGAACCSALPLQS